MARMVRWGLVFGMAILALGGLASARAQTFDSPFEGTWDGANGAMSTQVIIDGQNVIGFFWRDDYLDATNDKLSKDGRSLSFAFDGGQATLTRLGAGVGVIQITDKTGVTRLQLKRD